MGKVFETLSLGCAAWLLQAIPSFAEDELECRYGRLFPAKAIHAFGDQAMVEVDLGFGMVYRGRIPLEDTKRPSKPFFEWFDKAQAALSSKIDGKALTLCVHGTDNYKATYFVDGENINKWMVKSGYLVDDPPFICRPVSTAF